MKHTIPGAILAFLIVAAAPAWADPLKEFGCGRTLETRGRRRSNVPPSMT